jgi:hypothetical protein
MIKFLLDKGVNIKIFGRGWGDYPEFKKIYAGPVNQEDYAKIINESKINLSLTRAEDLGDKKRFNMKGRFFENALCSSFQLIEDFPTVRKVFKKGEDTDFFSTKEELLEKINYYLKNEKERERMAKNCYKKTTLKYNREISLRNIFAKVFKEKKKWEDLPRTKKIIITITKKDIFSQDLKEKVKNGDYIAFEDKNMKNKSEFKEYFLSRALDMTKKEIACCDYYLSSHLLKDYMIFISIFAFGKLKKEANSLIDINQLMVKKSFFLENLEIFKKLFNKKEPMLITEENTAFVSIPLISIKRKRKLRYDKMMKVYEMRIQNNLFSLIYQNKLFHDKYPYFLLLKSFFGNQFILKYLWKSFRNQNIKDGLIVNEVYTKNSPAEKLKDRIKPKFK